jgi:hypothetical protein
MDHSIGQGLTMADKILRGDLLGQVEDSDREFWNEAPAATPATAAPSTAPPAHSPDTALPAMPASVAATQSAPQPATAMTWMSVAVGTLLAGTVSGLSVWFGEGFGGLLYFLLYLLALVPGLPVGFALFGRRHAAGWIAGALIGYAITALTLWAVIASGMAGILGFSAAWAAVTTISWTALGRRGGAPLAPLPVWRRRDTLALLVTMSLVPVLITPAFRNLGAVDAAGNKYYRAYFTADFLWHGALTAELSKFEMPPRDPYVAEQPLNYYWSHFLLPASALGTQPLGLWNRPIPILKVNALASGLLFIGAIAVFVWSLVPRAWPMFWGVALSLLAASLEGLYALNDLVQRSRSFDATRYLNIDAITSWTFRSLTIDGLPRSLWYTPQHAMACALGLIALIVAGRARDHVRWPAAFAAGALLGGGVMMSPFLGGIFALIYGITAAWTFGGGRSAWARRVATHSVALVPVLAAIAWCAANRNFDGAGAAIHFGFSGPITRAPFITPLLALGPLLLAAICGVMARRFVPDSRLTPALVAVIVGFGLFYFVTLPGGDLVWVGWRAGQILLITLPALAAIWLAWLSATRGRLAMGIVAIGALFVLGLPTTIIDTNNAQDISNTGMGPGFKWTVVVGAAQRRGAAWIRTSTPKDAIVQMSPVPRGRETWTFIPTFAERRMAAGLPISLLKKSIYDERSQQVHQMYGTATAEEAWRIADDLNIDYVYMDAAEHTAYGEALNKFSATPARFTLVFADEDVRIYRVL